MWRSISWMIGTSTSLMGSIANCSRIWTMPRLPHPAERMHVSKLDRIIAKPWRPAQELRDRGSEGVHLVVAEQAHPLAPDQLRGGGPEPAHGGSMPRDLRGLTVAHPAVRRQPVDPPPARVGQADHRLRRARHLDLPRAQAEQRNAAPHGEAQA